MVDKSKWLEDEEEWLIPTLRMKSMDCSSSSSFPGIHTGVSNSSSHANLLSVAGNFSGMMGGSPRSSADSSSNYPSKKKTISPCNSGPIPPQKQSLNLSLPVGGGSVSLPNLPSARLRLVQLMLTLFHKQHSDIILPCLSASCCPNRSVSNRHPPPTLFLLGIRALAVMPAKGAMTMGT
jgi:hypothetical protein